MCGTPSLPLLPGPGVVAPDWTHLFTFPTFSPCLCLSQFLNM